MEQYETALVLAKAALIDMRTIGDEDVLAWHEIVCRIEFHDALAAVVRHYAETRDRLMPADLIRHARAIREERRRVEHHEVLALPGRFEDDADRDERVKAGAAKVRRVIAPLVARLSLDREPVFQKSTHGPRGAWWEDDDARERHATEELAKLGRLHLEREAS